jgi:iron(II)-dependent oxidoreductase
MQRAPAANPAAALDDPVAIRSAGRDVLSLALMDSRNLLLHLLSQNESALALRRAAHAGWYQEYWIARHLQRQRGEACDALAPRLAGIEPAVDEWLGPGSPPPPQALRAYLAQTLEVTLDLLAGTPEDDVALHFFRMSLLHEDRLGESLVHSLQAARLPTYALRDPVWQPAQRWRLGSERPQDGGSAWVPLLERWAHEVQVPEFDIDAQPVNWARYVEFAEDGGYDREELWSAQGWAWVQAQGRRAPRGVEQLRGGVLVQRGPDMADAAGAQAAAALVRAAPGQPVVHVTQFEAQAWCAWAGRRLPTEPEWEIAACRAGGQGFVWGDVFEWVAGSARAWPGVDGVCPPGSLDQLPPPGGHAVLRGASVATRRRWRHAKSRRFVPPTHDHLCCGFRSCAF